jgi:hypothetical protein
LGIEEEVSDRRVVGFGPSKFAKQKAASDENDSFVI